MAQKVIVELTDDLDGSTQDVETVHFGLDGHDWEIDLSGPNAEQFRAVMADYINHGRRRKKEKRADQPTRAIRPKAGRAGETQAIRDWAKSQGLPIQNRGRIPEAIQAAYNAGHAS